MEALEQMLKRAWEEYPQVQITVKEVQRISQVKRWDACEKNALYVFVRKLKRYDKVHVVKHGMEGIYEMGIPAEEMAYSDLAAIGVLPGIHQHCFRCKEFSPRISISGLCLDCEKKDEEAEFERWKEGKVNA